MADCKEPARSASRSAAPTAAFYLARQVGKMKGETAKLRAAWSSYGRGGCGARRSRRRQWRRRLLERCCGWMGQDGVSRVDERPGQRYWLGIMTGREHRKSRATFARRAACTRHAVHDCERAACGCHAVRGLCFGRSGRSVSSIRRDRLGFGFGSLTGHDSAPAANKQV